MARVTELQSRFDGGMDQDNPMHELGSNKVFLVENMLPSLESQGAIQMRNGWADYSGDLSVIRGATTSVAALGTSEFGSIYAVDEDGEFWKFAPTTDVGAAIQTRERLRTFAGKTIVTHSGGASAPRYYDGTTLGTLAGSPPNGRYSEIHKSRFLIANTASNPTRVWFSGGFDPTSWDTTNRYIDTSRHITGLASVNNMLLVFSWDGIERIRGSIPPPGSDMVVEPVSGSVGCIDNRSISVYGNKAIFASSSGLYETDGVSVRNLSDEAGMRSHYRESATGTFTFSGIAWNNYYILSVPVRDICYVVDLVSNSWFTFTNVKASMFTNRTTSAGDLFFSSHDTPYVRQADNLFNQFEDSYQDSQDADSNRIEPRIQTAYYGVDRLGPKRWKMLHPLYDLQAAAGTPTMQVACAIASPDALGDFDVSKVLPATSALRVQRERVPLGFASPGASFDFRLTPGSARINTFRLYRLDANVHAREPSRGVFA